MIYLVIASIWIITGLVWLVNNFLPFKICPICAGVSGTWLLLLLGNWLGYGFGIVLPLLLMGGSVVGIAYQLEKRLPENRSPLVWKTIFIPLGFLVAYYLALFDWTAFLIFLGAELIFFWFYFRSVLWPGRQNRPGDKQVEKLEKQMEKCC